MSQEVSSEATKEKLELSLEAHLAASKQVNGFINFSIKTVVGARILTQAFGRMYPPFMNTRTGRSLLDFIGAVNRMDDGDTIPKSAYPEVCVGDLFDKIWAGHAICEIKPESFAEKAAEARTLQLRDTIASNRGSIALPDAIMDLQDAQDAVEEAESDEEIEANFIHASAEGICRLVYENMCEARNLIAARYDAGEEIPANELAWLVNQTSDLTFKRGKETFVGRVNSFNVNDSFMGRTYSFSVRLIVQDNNNAFAPVHENLTMRAGATITKNSGFLYITSPEEVVEMTARGKHICKTFFGIKYMQYDGAVTRKSWYGDKHYNANGKVIVDRCMMRRMDPSYSMYFGGEDDDHSGGRGVDLNKQKEFVLEEHDYRYVSPVFYGFSFRAKMWGEFSLTGMSEVVYNPEALDKVVLPQETKDIVRALVQFNHLVPSKDLVGEKGAGSSFLLYGTPGLGKTLLVEAVSEYLEKPLYRVTAGELGTAPEEVEEKLMNLLDMCTVWDANLLIDEADIFMETRQASDIHRNAIVSIFLRTIEYYHGNLFLTTNRKDQIDPAFLSRISLCIPFEPQTESGRESVWQNLLGVNLAKAVIDKLHVKSYAKVDLNNREIHHIIRLALVKAKSMDKEVSHDEFASIFRMRGLTLPSNV